MRILVLGDTHIPHRAKELPAKVVEEIKKADLIVHAGDFSDILLLRVLQKLAGKAKVKAVWGNMDSDELLKELPEVLIFEVPTKSKKIKIGLYHGDGPPWGMEARVIVRLCAEYGDEAVKNLDIIIFGHDHQPKIEKIDSCIFFNPGSPTDVYFAPYKSYGIIEIDEKSGKIKTEIVKL